MVPGNCEWSRTIVFLLRSILVSYIRKTSGDHNLFMRELEASKAHEIMTEPSIPTRGYETAIVSGTIGAIAIAVVSGRVYARAVVQKNIGYDDCILLLALVRYLTPVYAFDNS